MKKRLVLLIVVLTVCSVCFAGEKKEKDKFDLGEWEIYKDKNNPLAETWLMVPENNNSKQELLREPSDDGNKDKFIETCKELGVNSKVFEENNDGLDKVDVSNWNSIQAWLNRNQNNDDDDDTQDGLMSVYEKKEKDDGIMNFSTLKLVKEEKDERRELSVQELQHLIKRTQDSLIMLQELLKQRERLVSKKECTGSPVEMFENENEKKGDTQLVNLNHQMLYFKIAGLHQLQKMLLDENTKLFTYGKTMQDLEIEVPEKPSIEGQQTLALEQEKEPENLKQATTQNKTINHRTKRNRRRKEKRKRKRICRISLNQIFGAKTDDLEAFEKFFGKKN